jgi:hypothetical protein
LKNILLCLFLFVFPFKSFCQPEARDNELSIGIGILTTIDLYNYIDEDIIQRRFEPIFAASYRHYVGGKVAIGISLIQHSYKGTRYDGTYNNGYVFVPYHYDITSLCFDVKLANIKLIGDYVQYYAVASLGIILDGADKQVYPSGYFAPFCCRIGRTNAFFMEYGLGNRGLVHSGFSYRINDKEKTKLAKAHKKFLNRWGKK